MFVSSIADWIYNAARWSWHDPDGYNFISGPLADITLFGGAYAIARRHNCHVRGCWRIARSQVPGTSYVVCHRHHPHERPSAQQVLDAHADAVKKRAELIARIPGEALHDTLHSEGQAPPEGSAPDPPA